jgi:hypothetical protein
LTITSASQAGTLLSINISATINVPVNIPITFQFMAKRVCLSVITPVSKTSRLAITATAILLAGRKINRIYAIIKRDIDIVRWSIK